MTSLRRSTYVATALSMALMLTGCSHSSHHNGATASVAAPRSTTTSSSTNPVVPNASSTSSAETGSSSDTPSDSGTSTGDPLSSAAMTGNAPAPGSQVPGANGTPRGGQAGAPNTDDGQAQATNFLRTVFSYDTKIDTSESGAAKRASAYAAGTLASSLSTPTPASQDFTAAKAHHGYTTVSLKDSQYGQPSSGSNYLTVCKAVTITWHGDPGWKAPAPTTNSWCVDVLPGQTQQWQITSMSLVNQGA